MLCLPVDVLIFYKEPFGMVGTMLAMVFGFVPFFVLNADAAFPEREICVKTKGETLLGMPKKNWERGYSPLLCFAPSPYPVWDLRYRDIYYRLWPNHMYVKSAI